MIEERVVESFQRCLHIVRCPIRHTARAKAGYDLRGVDIAEMFRGCGSRKHVSNRFAGFTISADPLVGEERVAKVQNVKLEALVRF